MKQNKFSFLARILIDNYLSNAEKWKPKGKERILPDHIFSKLINFIIWEIFNKI